MLIRDLAVAAFLLAGLTACGGGGDEDVVEKGSPQSASSEASDSESPAEQGQLVEAGFGQDGQYVQGVALVENTSDHGGQTVTVNFNFLDAKGNVLSSVSQVDSFNIEGQTIAVQGFADVGNAGTEVASVEPTVLIEDDGLFPETEVDFGISPGELSQQYGAWEGKFLVKNPTAEPLKSPAVRVACRDASGKINGGGFTFPDLVPPNGETVAEVSLTVGSEPAECTAYVGGPLF